MRMQSVARIRLTTRLLGLALAVAAAAAALPAGASAAWAAPAARSQADARLLVCRQSQSIDGRVAVVGASMRPLPGARRMALKIDLFQRRHAPGARWAQRTDVPGLGSWVSPSDRLLGINGGDRFRYRQAVGRLVVGASYRFRVAFRWLDSAGAVARETTVVTRACRQPAPDLVLTGARTAPAAGAYGLVRYTLRVANVGRRAAARVTVAAVSSAWARGGAARRVVRRLAPGQAATVSFLLRACAAGDPPVAFLVDPDDTVEEVDETNNQLAVACPAEPSASATASRTPDAARTPNAG